VNRLKARKRALLQGGLCDLHLAHARMEINTLPVFSVQTNSITLH
jgi:hypothetical protein